MQPEIRNLKERKLVGQSLEISLAENKTFELWRNFMPRRKEITNNLTTELFTLQVYDSFYFDNFDPGKKFEKWALIEVSDFESVPDGMRPFTLKNGLYAVFNYKGLNTDTKIFDYIFGTWLPGSEYALDNRPHFCIMGEKYKNGDPDSEEEIWIPIRPKD